MDVHGASLTSGETFGFLANITEYVKNTLPNDKKNLVGTILTNFASIFNCENGITQGAACNQEFVELMKKFHVNGEHLLDAISHALMGDIVRKQYQKVADKPGSEMYCGQFEVNSNSIRPSHEFSSLRT